MTFNLQSWGRISSSANNDVVTLQDGSRIGAPSIYTYTTSADLQAAIGGAGYFDSIALQVDVGDLIYAVDSANVAALYNVSAVTATTVTVIQSTATGDVDGPAGATNNALVRFDGATGKIIKNGQILESDTGDLTLVNSIQIADGVVGTPSFRFTSDTDTGIYRVGNNTIGLVTQGGLQAQIGTVAASVNFGTFVGSAVNQGLSLTAPGVFIGATVADANCDWSVQGRGTGGLSILRTSAGTGATLRKWNPAGTFWNAFVTGANVANVTYTEPTAAPTADGQALVSTMAGVQSWADFQSMTWSAAAVSAGMAVNNGYVTTGAGLITMTLPAVAAVGDIIEVVGQGAGGWSIAQNAGQVIHLGGTPTTVGVGGSLASSNRYDAVRLVCVVADTEFVVAPAGTYVIT